MRGRQKSEFCIRGHLLAETRRITASGKTRCYLCATQRAAAARARNPVPNREAVRKYQKSHSRKFTLEQMERRREAARRYYEKKIGRPVKIVWGRFRADPKAYHLRWLLEKRYGLTLEQYNEMVEVQGGRCAICNNIPTGKSHTSQRLAVDHDHATNTVRGLLCGTCNTTIGMIEDRPELLDRMRRYLSKHAQLRLVESK